MKQDFTYKDLVLNDEFRAWVIDKIDNQHWDKWVKENSESQSEIDKAISLIVHLNFEKYEMPLKDQADLWARIENSKSLPEATKTRFFSLGLKIAASLLILIVAGIAIYTSQPGEPDHAPISLITKENPKGRKTTHFLPDGSKVMLNSGSVLRYPSSFADNKREVEVEGEAFFDVKRDEARPFVVSSGQVQTQVLGTSFNVYAYPNKNSVAVMLASGKVKVSGSAGALSGHSYLLNPGEQFVYKRNSKSVEVSTYDSEEAFGWKEGILLFNNCSLEAIAWKLEMWYNVDIDVQVDSPASYHFTGKFRNQSLEHVLKGMSFTLGFDYSINNKKVTISN